MTMNHTVRRPLQQTQGDALEKCELSAVASDQGSLPRRPDGSCLDFGFADFAI